MNTKLPTAYLSGEGGTITIAGQSYPVDSWYGIQFDGKYVEGNIALELSDANAIEPRTSFMMTSTLADGEAIALWGEVEDTYWTKDKEAVQVIFGQAISTLTCGVKGGKYLD